MLCHVVSRNACTKKKKMKCLSSLECQKTESDRHVFFHCSRRLRGLLVKYENIGISLYILNFGLEKMIKMVVFDFDKAYINASPWIPVLAM